jgi:hypothetical protein
MRQAPEKPARLEEIASQIIEKGPKVHPLFRDLNVFLAMGTAHRCASLGFFDTEVPTARRADDTGGSARRRYGGTFLAMGTLRHCASLQLPAVELSR